MAMGGVIDPSLTYQVIVRLLSFCASYHIVGNGKLAEGEAPVPHHDRIAFVGEHPVEQRGEDLLLHLDVDAVAQLALHDVVQTRRARNLNDLRGERCVCE